MADRTTQSLTALTGFTSVPLFITQGALAHTGHAHTQDPEPSEAPVSEPDTASPESNTDKTTDSSSTVMPSSAMPMDAADEMPIQENPVTQESLAATRASITEGFSLGFEESLLVLIVAGPLLLWSLKKQLQSR